jgi:hypothetical protein
MAKRDRFLFTNVEAYQKFPYRKHTDEPVQTCEVFVKKKEHSDDKRAVTYKEYNNILKMYGQVVLEELFKGNKVDLPYALGDLLIKRYVKKENSRAKNINWHETNKVYGEWNEQNPTERKFVEYDNSHSNGQTFYIKWSSSYFSIKNKIIYKFRLKLENRKRFADLLRSDYSTQFNYENI